MAHYDLYDSIGLDRTATSAELSEEIARRLREGLTANPGGSDELQVAHEILGDAGRRGRYDAILADPAEPDLTIAGLRRLAAADIPAPKGSSDPTTQVEVGEISDAAPASRPASAQWGGQQLGQPQQSQGFGGAQWGQPQPQAQQNPPGFQQQASEGLNNAKQKLAGATASLRGEYARSSRAAVAATAVATALVCLLAFGLISWLGGSGDEYAEPKKMASKLLKARNDDARMKWLEKHFDEDECRTFVSSGDVCSPEGASEQIAQMAERDDARVVDAYNAAMSFSAMSLSFGPSVGGLRVDEALEKEHGISDLIVVGVGDDAEGPRYGDLWFEKRDGEWQFVIPQKFD